MPHNVYTGDEEGRVVRSSFFDLKEWCSREAGYAGQVEWKGGEKTTAEWGGTQAAVRRHKIF
jgi:hypothetical protein